MKQMFVKRIVWLLLVALMLVPLAACTPPDVPEDSTPTSEEENAMTTATSAESTGAMDGTTTVSSEVTGTAASGTPSTAQSTTKATTKAQTTTRTTIDRDANDEFTTKLPRMTYPLKVGEADGANSGKKGNIYVVDYQALVQEGLMSGERYRYDMTKFLSALQGVLNREKPVLYIMDYPGDYTENLFVYMRQKDSLLYGYKRVDIDTFEGLITTFKKEIQAAGLITWDEKVPATVNAATVACGVDGYLPVRYTTEAGSVYNILTKDYGVSVKVDLNNKFTGKGTIWDTKRASTGSPKNDAHIWAIEKYMSKTSDKYMGYAMDAISWNGDNSNPTYKTDIYATYVPNTDYFVARKAFVFDLNPWVGEVSTDEPNAPAGVDYNTLVEILTKQYNKHGGKGFTQVTGFPGIETKYSDSAIANGPHDGAASEFRTVEVLTAYNCNVDADCPGMSSMFNCSVYMHFPLKSSYKNNRPTSIPKYDPNKKYIMYYMGDCDSASWISRFYMLNWQDEARGEIPLAFPYNVNLSERIPVVFDYFRTTATENDYFIGGDSGAGYVNPTLLVEGMRKHSNLPDALDAWINYCTPLYKQFDITITGFVLNGWNNHTKEDLSAFSKFSPDGIAVWHEYDKLYMLGDMPVIGMFETYTTVIHDGIYVGDAEKAFQGYLEKIEAHFENRNRAYPFYALRNNLTSPSYITRLTKELKARNPEVEVVDPYTFYALIKQALEK